MPESDKPATPSLDERLKSLGLVLGLISTGLGVFVAIKTNFIATVTSEIDTQVKEARNRSTLLEAELRQLELKNKAFENSVRLVAEWQVLTANDFARGMDEGLLNLVWLDDQQEQQMRDAAKAWKAHYHLMSRAADQSLLLRQVVCLRLMNVGNTPATELRLLAHQRDFDAQRGGQGGLYSAMTASFQGEPKPHGLGQLMEPAQQSQRLSNEILIPVAHVVGSQRYVGRLILPVRLLWKDPRQQREGQMEIRIDDPRLANKLRSGDLGQTSK
ncbi:hypothetical protein [Paucibacter sp. XJ19-41]|uniref:hypothetical protein n=1 Tax=Paucibacter sp. XJ19-41 TaxID=2927824 RepID=UPI00234A2757|nr:hypothetical protein [Paucibacter sp. XJ19-41]MDC6168218.1 hypothetical protein [Paucibacter sp. XJ19-41]